MTSMTSGSPSAMSSALASRLSKRWRCTWASRISAWRSASDMAALSSEFRRSASATALLSSMLRLRTFSSVRRWLRSPMATSTKASGNMMAMRMPTATRSA